MVDVLFKAYPLVLRSCRSNLAGRGTLNSRGKLLLVYKKVYKSYSSACAHAGKKEILLSYVEKEARQPILHSREM